MRYLIIFDKLLNYKLGITALGVSALGKKRHRVEVARRLVFGSVVASFESRKDVLYPEESKKNALFRVLDCSLPWWTERDSWGRWTSTSSGPKDSVCNSEAKCGHPTLPCDNKIANRNRRILIYGTIASDPIIGQQSQWRVVTEAGEHSSFVILLALQFSDW